MTVTPPRRRRTQAERTALSDRRMFEAAVSLIVGSGLDGTTLAAIGERAGYSRGLVTHRFGSKANLFAYVHDMALADWISRVNTAVGERVGTEALSAALDALFGFLTEEPDEIRAMYLLRYSSIDPGAVYRANVAKAHLAQRRDIERWLEEGKRSGAVHSGVDSKLAAEYFCATLDGSVYRWLVNPEVPIDELNQMLKAEIGRMLELGPVG